MYRLISMTSFYEPAAECSLLLLSLWRFPERRSRVIDAPAFMLQKPAFTFDAAAITGK